MRTIHVKRPFIVRDDLALIGLTAILGFVWYFFHWLLG